MIRKINYSGNYFVKVKNYFENSYLSIIIPKLFRINSNNKNKKLAYLYM